MINAVDQKRFHILIEYSRCGNCGACVAVCPADALHLNQVRLISKDENCTGCKSCIITCPADALALSHE